MYRLLIIPVLVFSVGCVGLDSNSRKKEIMTEKKEMTSPEYVLPLNPPKSDGSLWSENSNHGFLFGDIRARQVGDIVTIKIIESASGSKDASTNTSKDSSIAGGLDLFGIPTRNQSITASTKNGFTGKGATSRSGTLTASVTATVIEKLYNGNLVISGERRVLINDEEQLIKLVGTIRPADIDSENKVLSTRIANANIEYTGKGIFEDRQKPGWGARVFDWVWPF